MVQFLRFALASVSLLALCGAARAQSYESYSESVPGFEQAPPPVEVRPAPVVPAVPRGPVKARIHPGDFALAANTAVFSLEPPVKGKHDPSIARLQVLMDRNNVSPGVIDGFSGGNLTKAIMAAQRMFGLPEDGVAGRQLWTALDDRGDDVFSTYDLTEEDVAGPFVPHMPSDYAEMAMLERLAYRDPVEMLAERFHMDEDFLRALNPGVDFTTPGAAILVADIGKPAKEKVARMIADKSRRQVLGFDANGRLVVAYPATIGSSDLPSPIGIHAVKAVAAEPEYWYRPQVNFQQGDNTKALRLAPGPNNPVGAVWIGLDKPTYGIHGSPEPSKIDKTNSHGCIRLTNWDAQELIKLVAPGVTVEFVDQAVDLTSTQ